MVESRPNDIKVIIPDFRGPNEKKFKHENSYHLVAAFGLCMCHLPWLPSFERAGLSMSQNYFHSTQQHKAEICSPTTVSHAIMPSPPFSLAAPCLVGLGARVPASWLARTAILFPLPSLPHRIAWHAVRPSVALAAFSDG